MTKVQPSVHIVGAGLAGLACAVRLARAGLKPALYEAADHAGGRCRSYFEPALDRLIDNGNHLVLSGNVAVQNYLADIGATDELLIAPEPAIPFIDLRTGRRWTLRPNQGRFPWWLFSPTRRVPDSRVYEYLAALKLALAGPETRIAECFDAKSPLYERFWEPLTIAILNTSPQTAAARLLWPVMALLFGKGGKAARPCQPREGLSQTFIDPALAWLAAQNCPAPSFHTRLKAVEHTNHQVKGLGFAGRRVDIPTDGKVVIALPPAGISNLLPEITVPEESCAIVNAHFRLETPCALPDDAYLLGLIGATSQWLFLRGDIASVTISAADDLATESAETIAGKIWPEIATALGLTTGTPLPPFRIVKEKRATFAQTPASLSRRPPTRTKFANLYLAGDWTDTGLPATIEGAILSGHKAAAAILKDIGKG